MEKWTWLLLNILQQTEYTTTPPSRLNVFHAKLMVSQRVKNFLAIYLIRKFIAVFIRTRHRSLISQMNPIYTLMPSFCKIPFNTELSSSLHLPSGLFPSDFTVNILYLSLIFPMRDTNSVLFMLLDLSTLILFRVEYAHKFQMVFIAWFSNINNLH